MFTWFCRRASLMLNAASVAAAVVAGCPACNSSNSDAKKQLTDGGSLAPDASPSGPHCVRLECLTDDECCLNAAHVCKATCASGKCAFICGPNPDCPSCVPEVTCPPSAPVCDNGKCAQCSQDAGCTGTTTCVAGHCVGKCDVATQCPALHACINGICVADRCSEDGECKNLTGNPSAKCSTQGTCEASCEQDGECAAFAPLLKNARCESGRCTAPGCSSSEQCLEAYRALGPNDPTLEDAGAYVECVSDAAK